MKSDRKYPQKRQRTLNKYMPPSMVSIERVSMPDDMSKDGNNDKIYNKSILNPKRVSGNQSVSNLIQSSYEYVHNDSINIEQPSHILLDNQFIANKKASH